MGILDEKRYADNMTRTEVADALKNGHPLIAGYLVADAAKQMQENDALLKVLEQQSGISQPGQSITDKLETYLRNPNAAQQQKPGGPPGGPPKGPPGGPPRRPGPMPQGGPPGAGGPMPGPRGPGGAGGAMPGAQLGPQGAGALMRRGGIVGFQQGGGVADELTYGQEGPEEVDDVFGPFNEPWVYGTDWLRPKSELDYALMGLTGGALATGIGAPASLGTGATYAAKQAGTRLLPKILQGVGTKIGSKIPYRPMPGGMEAIRRSIGPGAWGKDAGMLSKGLSMVRHPFRTVSGGIGSLRVPFTGRSMADITGSGLARMSTQGGIRGRISNLLTGGPDRMLGTLPKGARSIPAELFAQRAGARLGMGAAGVNYLDDMLYGDRPLSEADLSDMIAEGGEFGRRTSDPESGPPRSMYQDLFDQIQEYERMAAIPSTSELARYKLDEDRAGDLRDRRAGIEALMPTEGQYADTARSVGFGGLSKVLARTGDPSKRQDFGQVGEDVRRETARQLGERIGFEEKLAGIGTDIYGVEGGSLDRRSARERAGDPYKGAYVEAMQSAAEAEASRRSALMAAMINQQGQNNPYRSENIVRLIELANDYTAQIPDATRATMWRRINEELTGMSSAEIDELSERFEQAQVAE